MSHSSSVQVSFAERHWWLLSVVACFFAPGCGSGSDAAATCPAGTPTPIASDTMAAVAEHHFERHGQESVEELTLVGGERFELYQSGCDLIRQEFRFLAPAPAGEVFDQDLFREAAKRFRKMSGLSPVWAPFAQWADAIEAIAAEGRPGVPIELPGHIRLRVEDYRMGTEWWLVVVLEQRIE